jgi:DNA invertase Pin-like site-specific DNA recombinase
MMRHQPDGPTGSRGAAYVRVSDEDQDTARQHTSIREWAARHLLAITKQFADEGGRRHKAESRPGFQSLLKAVESGSLDWIVVDHQDRLGFKGPFEWYHPAGRCTLTLPF